MKYFIFFSSLFLLGARAKGELKTMEVEDGVLFVYTQEAKEVYVAGDFNNWNSTSHRMAKDGNVFKLLIKLPKGRYQYKFVVDGIWKEDPLNPNKTDDGYGGFNSVIEVKKSGLATAASPRILKDGVEFYYEGSANSVMLAGSFNNWQAEPMKKTGNKFVLVKNLPPGRYEYKFIVDGNWKEDPLNPNKKDDGYGGFNSVVEVKGEAKRTPEITKNGVVFKIEANASSVLLAGSFNNWQGEPMTKKGNIWTITKKLKPGRYQYKFVVDGVWKEDPLNPDKADDGFGGFNSVVEVK